MRKKPGLGAKLLLSLVSLILILAVLEVGLRIAGYGLGTDRLRWVGSADLDYVPVPNQDTWFGVDDPATGEQKVPIHINGFGQRGKDYPAAKEPGEFRIIGLGDSLTFGPCVRDEETYLAVLEQLYGKRPAPAPRIRVANSAANGYATVHYLKWLETQLDVYHPDLVVVGCYTGNDMVIPARVTSLLPLGMDSLMRRSALCHFLYEMSRKYLWKRVKAVKERKSLEKIDQELDQYVGVNEGDLSLEGQKRLWEHSLGHMQRMHEIAQAKGVKLVCLLIPTPWMMTQGNAAEVYPWLKQEIEKEGIPVISLIEELRAAGPQAWLPWNPGHWTPLGHRVTAETLQRGLTELGLVP
jgi:lysophospholipase L1-like esterase